jgi:hypothetical protein
VEVTEMKSDSGIRNPFGVMDVPDPNDDREVLEFAARAKLNGSPEDENAKAWTAVGHPKRDNVIEGSWSSRWNGGVDDTIPGDARDKWKLGQGEARVIGDRVYLFFNWDHGKRRGLIDARRDGANRLVGKYVNLNNPAITRPWIGLVVNNHRIDGRWPGGRLDFRR